MRDLRVALPSIDIHTIGSGGGSIGHVDIGGILHVGPESAGADPGPASYGKGGQKPAVTDANVVLGYFDPKSFLGGRTSFDGAAAEKAVAHIADALECSVVEAAQGIQRVVNTQMAEGVRVMSVRRGVDLRNYTLLSFGGAAGLHVSDVARMLDVKRIIVPGVASVLSAWGMLATDLRYELSRSHLTSLASADPIELRQAFAELEQQGREKLAQFDLGRIEIERTVDMRYGEQVFELNVPLDGVNIDAPTFVEEVIARFHKRHEDVYTYKSLQQEVILVNIRVSAIGKLDAVRPRTPSRSDAACSAPITRRV
ncbi:hydantoinase/oxoprolinase family protein [Bradyrhizobium sp. DASA03076]|uniref:hydantoinase/oxoprolinase family protein n=1 Tax=Bradyrhizobium sp. BLXBL-03 TaxID=3395916 RepID=UPI003F6EA907